MLQLSQRNIILFRGLISIIIGTIGVFDLELAFIDRNCTL